jgi:hypothetical protein
MLKKQILLALLLLLGLTSWASADSGFYGYVTFHYCSCLNPQERVVIQPTSGGTAYLNGIDCGNPPYDPPGYTTQGGTPQTFAPGNYYLKIGRAHV